MSLRTSIYRQKERLKRSVSRAVWGDCVVLLYHRVYRTPYDPQQLCVDPDIFHDQLTMLKKGYRFLEMDEFCEHLRSKKRFSGKTALVTFDDGYADNYENALPILESLGIQGVFYIATANIGSERHFWWDEVDLLFRGKGDADIPGVYLRKLGCTDLNDAYQLVLQLCKRAQSVEQRDEVLSELRTYLQPTTTATDNHRSLTESQLQEMSRSRYAVIGAHTVNHLSLGHIPSRSQRQEIEESVKFLRQHTRSAIRHIAFPYGDLQHFNSDTIEICRELGLGSAAANLYEIATPKSDLFCFPRFIVRNDAPEVLLNKIAEVRR